MGYVYCSSGCVLHEKNTRVGVELIFLVKTMFANLLHDRVVTPCSTHLLYNSGFHRIVLQFTSFLNLASNFGM